MTETIAEHADVVFPAEAYAEKEGTIVHPDGRLQRLRPAIARSGEIRAGWQVISELALRLGLDLDVLSGAMASQPAVRGRALLRRPHARGDRRARRRAGRSATAASRLPAGATVGAGRAGARDTPRAGSGEAELAGFRSVWDAPEVEHSPALEFLHSGGVPQRELVRG